jgi:hypothetical protein
MSFLERANSISAPAFTRADTAPRAAATSRAHGPSYAGAGSLRPAPNVMHKPFANIIPALAPAAHIPAYAPPPKTLRPQSAAAALTHKTAGVRCAAASAAAAAADANENSRFKVLSLETARREDSTMQEVSELRAVASSRRCLRLTSVRQVERMSLILKKWGYRERMSQAAGNSRDERTILKKISQNRELRDATHIEFERFMILAREETARMSAEVKKLFALSMEAAAKLEALEQEETELMAAANVCAPDPSAAAEAVAAAASGTSFSCLSCVSSPRGRLHALHCIPQPQLIKCASTSHCSGARR